MTRYSYPQSSLPTTLAPPRQKPDVPTRVSLAAASGTTIRAIWFAPESDGGDIVLKYRIEWDSVRTFDSGPDRTPLGSHELVVSAGACDPAVGPCEWTIGSLEQGTPYYVRVFSYNLHGFSILAGVPYPVTETPRTFASPPQMVVVQPVPTDPTALTVTFPPTANDGGVAVTKYLVEWDVMGSRAKTDVTINDVLYSLYDVQAITTSAGTDNLAGTFRVAFEGYATDSLAFDVRWGSLCCQVAVSLLCSAVPSFVLSFVRAA